ncbi:MAG: MoxR family ATPase [Nitrososphaerota archaeon]
MEVMGVTKLTYSPRAVAVFTYSRKPKNLKPGKVRVLSYRGKRVKVMLDPDGRRLKVLEAPKGLIPVIRKAETLLVSDGSLRIVLKEKAEPKPKPKKPEPAPPKPPTPPKEEKPPMDEKPQKPTPKVEERVVSALSEEQRRKAMFVPVPDKGPIPTPYIDWSQIPDYCKVSDVIYVDYPIEGAPQGMLKELREMFRRSRRYQHKAPVNILILGPKGTGKSELVKAFAAETGLPYWHVIGEEGLSSDELIGHWELKDGKSVWVEGIIPKAVRLGGILHFDEANVIDPEVLTRLDELLDSKRQLTIKETGEIVKAHPDLFVVFTMNPPIYEGLKNLPEHIRNRLTKRYRMDYPPLEVELKILKQKLGLSDDDLKLPTKTEPISGRLARDVMDVMKIVRNLRNQTDLSYTPSIRDVQAFVQDLLEGDDFFTAFDRNIKGVYWGEEVDRIEEALRAVRRRE